MDTGSWILSAVSFGLVLFHLSDYRRQVRWEPVNLMGAIAWTVVCIAVISQWLNSYVPIFLSLGMLTATITMIHWLMGYLRKETPKIVAAILVEVCIIALGFIFWESFWFWLIPFTAFFLYMRMMTIPWPALTPKWMLGKWFFIVVRIGSLWIIGLYLVTLINVGSLPPTAVPILSLLLAVSIDTVYARLQGIGFETVFDPWLKQR